MVDERLHGGAEKISRLIGMNIEKYLAADREAAVARNEWRQDAEANRGLKALMLAPNLIICRALLRGERLPWFKLNHFQAERYGLRRRHADGRYGLSDFNDVRS